MAPLDRRIVFRAAVAAVLMATVTLSACGRKGPLEPPPSAAMNNQDGQDAEAPPEKPDKPLILDHVL